MRKLFLLEDDLSLISGLTFAFKKQGFALDTARTLLIAAAVVTALLTWLIATLAWLVSALLLRAEA